MSNFIDLTGKRFGKLVATKRTESNKYGSTIWLCKCDCGKEKEIRADHLKSGSTRSCGCLLIRHGIFIKQTKYKQPQIYKSWSCMIQRCNNPNNIKYKDYGGRGDNSL